MARPSVSSLLRLARAGPSSLGSTSAAVSSRRSASSRPLPKQPYEPLRPLSAEHPPPVKAGFVHPLAKWDSFLDIPHDPSLQPGQVVANNPPIIPQRYPDEGSAADDKAVQKAVLQKIVGVDANTMGRLHRHTLVHKRVVHMTRGGRVASHYVLTIVGSPEKGLLGIGQGKSPTMAKAADQALSNAMKNMDKVCRFQNRTVWGDGRDMYIKFGGVKLQMRARAPGFGLRCSPALHKMFTSCGISDVSAKLYGSHNVMQVVKAASLLLQGGGKLPGFGDGLGGKGRKMEKGRGMRDMREIELERGRYGVERALYQ